jgi:hypothetical protein
MIQGYTISCRNEVCINTPTGHSHCFAFDYERNFLRISNRQNQSVVNAFSMYYPSLLASQLRENSRRRTLQNYTKILYCKV